MTLNLGEFKENINFCRRFEVRLKRPNPLFEKWLEEWRLEAAAKDLDIQHTFKKALVSLRKYPATLTNGKQCMVLENFSPKLCLKLDEKLQEHKKRFSDGGSHKRPVSPEIIINYKIEKPFRKGPSPPKINQASHNSEEVVLQSERAQVPEKIITIDHKNSGANQVTIADQDNWLKIPQPHELNGSAVTDFFLNRIKNRRNACLQLSTSAEPVLDKNEDNTKKDCKEVLDKLVHCAFKLYSQDFLESQQSVPKTSAGTTKTKGKGQNPYVPAKGTGAYALLITLHDYICRYGHKVGMTKKELKKEAQIFCDIPFNDHLPGSRYTPWAAMGQLCRKMLVVKVGCPAKYHLSAKGIELAEKLKNAAAETNSINDSLNGSSASSSNANSNIPLGTATQSTSKLLNDNESFLQTKPISSRKNKATKYLGSAAHTFSSSSSSDDGDVDEDEIDDDDYDDVDNRKFANKTPSMKLLDDDLLENYHNKCYADFRKAWKDSIFMDDVIPTKKPDKRVLVTKPSCTIVRPPSEEHEMEIDVGAGAELFSEYNSQQVLHAKNEENATNKFSCSSKQTFEKELVNFRVLGQKNSLGRRGDEGDMLKIMLQKNIPKPPSPSTSQSIFRASQSSVNSSTENIEMLPNNYNTVLLIDTSEMARKQIVEVTLKRLDCMNVECEIRHLNVGDYTWICRDPNGRELILPYIIERKRIDDLAKSIKDGRFHEQKFRLKSSPVKQRIYIVEGNGSCYAGGLPLSTLFQAATNTQLIDGFVVKFTKDYHHTLKYLATLTRKFSNLLNGKHLMSYFGEELPPFRWNESVLQLMTFKDFMKNASKKRKFTVREMFLRHLLQLHGVSVEKAKAIINKYPCPRLLLEAYWNGGLDENSLSKIKVGKLERSLGAVISKSIYNLYSKGDFS